MPNVSFVRDEVAKMKGRWDLVKDCLSGQRAIKDAREKYLPKPNPADLSEENKKRYDQYVERAVFYNVTQRTHAGLVGQVFQQDPIVKLPALMEPLLLDTDGAGVALDQQAKKALGEVLGYGRCGLFVDYPKVEGAASRQDLLDGKVRPTIILYDPWDIINWRTKTVGAKKLLSLVVIAESYVVEDDGFEAKSDKQWRVLRLEEGTGAYRVEIWREANGTHQEYEHYYPLDASGNNLKEIPFTFVGAVNNDPNVDLPPLYDLATLNIAHYRNSADYEEACYIVGQPTPYLAGLTKDWVEEVLKGQVHLGSRAAIPLPQGGTAGLLQANPNTMPKEAMELKERQMVALGAKLVEQAAVQRTATEARQEEASEASILATCAKNVAAAYRTALTWCGVFLGTDQEPEFDLNTDFEIGRMSAQDRAQLIAEWQAGAIAFEEMRFNLRRANVAYLDDEEAKDAIEEEMASGMGAGAALVYAQQMQQEQDPDADPNKDPQGNGGNNQPQ